MSFRLIETYFEDEVKVISPTVFTDARGYFAMTYREDDYAAMGLPTHYPQDSQSFSARNVLRGLHFQLTPPMGKLMRVTRGAAFLVAVNINPDSPFFLRHAACFATDTNMQQLYAPAHYARGFYSMADDTIVQYKCTGLYDPKGDAGIRWDDPAIGISWPAPYPMLSDKDKNAPTVDEYLRRKA